jgi:hypothetical protein
VQTQRLGIGDQKAEDTSARRAESDRRFPVVVQPNGEKLLEPGPILIEDAEGAIVGAHQGDRFFDNMLEERRKLNVGLDHEDGIHKVPEFLRIVYALVRHGTRW